MSSSGGSAGGDENWDDWQDDAPFLAATRDVLHYEKEHESPAACLHHCAVSYSWDLQALAKRLQLDIYGSIRMVNWLRRQVAEHRQSMDDAALVDHLQQPFQSFIQGGDGGVRPAFLDDDEFLHPYLPDDALLPALSCESWEGGGDDKGVESAAGDVAALRRENEELKGVLEQQQDILMSFKTAMLNFDDSTPSAAKSEEELKNEEDLKREKETGWDTLKETDKSYFRSYAKYGIHHEMLSDRVRTSSYQAFLMNNPSLIKDKVVLDIGCGTGILCMFAAKAGAKQVIGIDMSDIILDARKIVEENKLSHIITLIQGRAEDVVLPVDKVDVIVSEWMGYMLLYESMLDSVIHVRDKYLCPEGVCMPNKCIMQVVGLEDTRMDFWDDVYGFSMKTIKEKILDSQFIDPVVEVFESSMVATDCAELRVVDCQTTSVAELEFKGPFRVIALRDFSCAAIVSWFDTVFDLKCDNAVIFSTGPHMEPTHWKQTAFYLKEPLAMKKGDALEGVIHLSRHAKNIRHLDFVLEWAHQPHGGIKGPTQFQTYEFA